MERLYLKPVRGKPAIAVASGATLRCEAGVGIHGDAHAHRLSPRQVLVTLASELRDLRIAPGALGENIVIACDRPELFRPGSAIVAASGVAIRLTMFCEPCKRIAYLANNLSALLQRRGVLGVIEAGGELREGDALTLIGGRYQPLPESPYQKFLDFLPTIPAGRVLRYADVALAIGAADGFVRAIPGYLRRSTDPLLPRHRIVNARGELLRVVPDQAAKLRAEGVIVSGDINPDNARAPSVDLARYLWGSA